MSRQGRSETWRWEPTFDKIEGTHNRCTKKKSEKKIMEQSHEYRNTNCSAEQHGAFDESPWVQIGNNEYQEKRGGGGLVEKLAI